MLRFLGQALLVIALLAAGAVSMGGMIVSRPVPETRVPDVPVPYVDTERAVTTAVTLPVKTRGTVSPRTEGVLASEVAGRIVEVAPALVAGGFFREDDVLVRIDPRDFELSRMRARATVAACEARLARVRAEAEVAAAEWKVLEEGEASPLALRKPQLLQAEAELEAARAALEHAEIGLERTAIRAPYCGCVRETLADTGQYVAPGAPLARIFAVDHAEVRLPLSDEQVARLDLDAVRRGGGLPEPGPAVLLRGRSGGTDRTWTGAIVRVEGHVDPRTRMTTVVARVSDPYGLESDGGSAPLAVGLFVEAQIASREIPGVAVVPRTALQEGSRVVVVDGESRLRFRPVRVVQAVGDRAVVEGLEDGATVCLLAPQGAQEGMVVRTGETSPAVESSREEREVTR